MSLLWAGCQPVMPPTPTAGVTPTVVEEEPTSAVTTTLVSAEEPTATPVSESEPSAVAEEEILALGLKVYRAQYCGVCHVLDAAETRGNFGPPHNGMGTTAAQRLLDPNYKGSATTPAEYITESILDPLAYSVPGYGITSHRMPQYTHLSAAEVAALTAFLLAQ